VRCDIYMYMYLCRYIYIYVVRRLKVKSLCAPDDRKTRLSFLTTWLSLTAWQPTARARGTLDPHCHLLSLILNTLSW
jgi:hypothetical protein